MNGRPKHMWWVAGGRWVYIFVWGWLLGAVLTACGSSEEIVVKTADGVEISARDIDANPLALLPPGALVLANVQPQELFQSQLGARFVQLAKSQFPLPPGAQFEPQRDLDRLLVGAYSIQGVDLAGVAVGRFNVEAIADAARRSEITPLGVPLVRVKYSHWEFYVAGNVGFCPLTSRTALFGNEVGMRRALDRLERGELSVQQENDLVTLVERPGAPLAIGASNSDAGLNALARYVPLVRPMRMARVVANLQPPGVNIAGTLTFDDAQTAEQARLEMNQAYAALQTLTTVGAVFGLDLPVRNYEASVLKTSLQVTIAAEVAAAVTLLNMLDTVLLARRSNAHTSPPFNSGPN